VTPLRPKEPYIKLSKDLGECSSFSPINLQKPLGHYPRRRHHIVQPTQLHQLTHTNAVTYRFPTYSTSPRSAPHHVRGGFREVLHLPGALQRVSRAHTLRFEAEISRLYCSSECRIQDKGTRSHANAAGLGPVRITSHFPLHLSPLSRPTMPIGPSPKMPAHLPSRHLNGDSSSSSSIASSPIQSPRTNPSASDSPTKEVFNLPPPAYPPHQTLPFPGSVPVKIPAPVPRPLGPGLLQDETPASHSSTVYPIAGSIDTLRFGRKPAATNSVTSPNALLPQCACGKPANHQGRPSSGAMNADLAHLNLGPAVTTHHQELTGRSIRVVSESAIPSSYQRLQNAQPHSSQASPRNGVDIRGGSSLSRSRSDPIPPSPKGRPGAIAPMTKGNTSNIAPSRRASVVDRAVQPAFPAPGESFLSTAAPAGIAGLRVVSPSRGRSRERQVNAVPLDSNASSIFNPAGEREQAPSRSRHRREERRRSNEPRQADGDRVCEVAGEKDEEPTGISPTWSRHTSLSSSHQAPGEGMAPNGRSGQRSSLSEEDRGHGVTDEARGRKEADLRKASNQLGQIFGIAAG